MLYVEKTLKDYEQRSIRDSLHISLSNEFRSLETKVYDIHRCVSITESKSTRKQALDKKCQDLERKIGQVKKDYETRLRGLAGNTHNQLGSYLVCQGAGLLR